MTNLPAFFQSRTLIGAATAGLGGSRPAHVSRKDNRFTLVDAAGNEKPVETFHLDMVIVGVNPATSKKYYEGPYAMENVGPPTCWSDNGTGPSAYAAKPQAKTCMMCPHNAWGTGQGGAGRACQDSKKLAVIVPGDASGLVYEFTVPPGSFNSTNDKSMGWKQYCMSIAGYDLGGRKADLFDVVTRVTFVSQGVLAFAPTGLTSQNQEIMQRFNALSEAAIDTAINSKDVARDPNLALEVAAPSVPVPSGPPSISEQAIAKRHRATKAEMELRRAATAQQTAQTIAPPQIPSGPPPRFTNEPPHPPPLNPNGNGKPQFGIQSNPPGVPPELLAAMNLKTE
jgi:hypothetical protein